MTLIHMISQEDAGTGDNFFDEVRITFKVDKIHGIGFINTESLVLDARNEGEPFTVIGVTEDGIFRSICPGIILNNTGEILVDKLFGLSPIHDIYYI